MTDQCNYVVPLAQLNVLEHEFGMRAGDPTYPDPKDWLRANARRFHVTAAQILEAAKPQLLTDYWAGERWSRHPQICGIYFLVLNGSIVYIGQSNHIARRIAQHQFNGVGFDSLAYFEAPECLQKEIESYYIARMHPPLNYDYPKLNLFIDIVADLGLDSEPMTPKPDAGWITIEAPTKRPLSPSPSTKEPA